MSSDLANSRSSLVQRSFFCDDVIAITSWAPDVVNLVHPIAYSRPGGILYTIAYSRPEGKLHAIAYNRQGGILYTIVDKGAYLHYSLYSRLGGDTLH